MLKTSLCKADKVQFGASGKLYSKYKGTYDPNMTAKYPSTVVIGFTIHLIIGLYLPLRRDEDEVHEHVCSSKVAQ